jgi:hypothetical protein
MWGVVPLALVGPRAARAWLDAPTPADPRQGTRRGAHRGLAPARLAAHQKGARRSGRVVACVDETGFTFRARVDTTWAPIGHAPVLRRVSARRAISSVVTLTAPLDGAPPRLLARHFLGTIHADEVIIALRYFRARLGQPLVIVWDRLSAHRARPLKEFLARHPSDYRVEWLPGYGEEKSPISKARLA